MKREREKEREREREREKEKERDSSTERERERDCLRKQSPFIAASSLFHVAAIHWCGVLSLLEKNKKQHDHHQ